MQASDLAQVLKNLQKIAPIEEPNGAQHSFFIEDGKLCACIWVKGNPDAVWHKVVFDDNDSLDALEFNKINSEIEKFKPVPSRIIYNEPGR